MTNPNFVNVELRCRCEGSVTWCVRVSRGVPAQLRCSPGGGGGSPEIRCGQCGHRCFPSIGAFENAVHSAIDRGSAAHVKARAVIIEC